MNSDDLENPKLRYDYLQSQFRKQAQKQIDKTKQRLNAASHDSFASMQKAAFDKMMTALKQMGIYNTSHELINGKTQEEANALFDVYYNAYLEREKSSPSSFKPKHILGKANF